MRVRPRDTFDVLCGVAAGAADAVAVFSGFMLAVWIRFDSGWIPVTLGHPPRFLYVTAAGMSTLLYLLLFRVLGLYARPQDGHFTDKIPRIIRACGIGALLSLSLAFAIRTEPPLSRLVAGIAFGTVTLMILVERNILFALERHWAKYQAGKRRVLIIGAGPLAAKLKDTLESEPRHRARVVGFLMVEGEAPAEAVPESERMGALDDLSRILGEGEGIDEVVVANPSAIPHERLVDIIIETERNMARFLMVPDVFRLLTSKVEVRTLGDVSLLGMGPWPLDHFWNRILKRAEDIAGSAIGLLAAGPVVLLAAWLIRRESPGPAFYRQRRCGERGRPFTLLKLRTMIENAEAATGPVWTRPDDPRRTRLGAKLRAWNIDELPQLWNVLRGDMSLVGPRPERPEFVEQFKDHIGRYMWRHVSRPGITGWAQINGLRGQTDLKERIRYDLWYLENWSLSLDFKIIARTFFARTNAY